MNSFLITYKPASENPERGWPIEELRKLVRLNEAGEKAVEEWRFNNRKDVNIGDRVFLLLQGKKGPAIIGYGEIAGRPKQISDEWYVPVQFESIVDPTIEVLVRREDILTIEQGKKFWRIQSSGVLLPQSVANDLEAVVVGSLPTRGNENSIANPDWTRDELIIALDFYLRHRRSPPGKNSQEIRELAEVIKRVGERLYPGAGSSSTFRNENGVYMKLMNFRSVDPLYTSEGKTGLVRGARADEEVWQAFANDPTHCQQIATAIIASLDDLDTEASSFGRYVEDEIQEAPEGRVLTRIHLARERNQKLVESKRRQAMAKHGKLLCEACGFNFALYYGDRGKGYIECHHTKPVATLVEGQKTHIDDLALVCANCHRMIHRGKPWLSIEELRALVNRPVPHSL
jgi:5-methylcytosine-specific restriction enzyme A